MEPDTPTPTHRRNHTTQSIPLQDLSRPPENDADTEDNLHRRTLSDRGRALFARGGLRRQSARYAALADRSSDAPPPGNDARTTHDLRDGSWLDDNDIHENTPMVDARGFQQAIGFAGLSFEGGPQNASLASRPLPPTVPGLGNLLSRNDSVSSLSATSFAEDSNDAEQDETDRTRLTDARHVQTMDGADSTTGATPSAQKHNRLSSRNLRFATPERSPGRAHLGDELASAESGMRGSSPGGRSASIARSLSPSSPLHRASTMVRKMSQRVVNLSNEPELVEHEMRRRTSGQRRREDPDDDTQSHEENASHVSSEKVSMQESLPPPQMPPGGYDWVLHANPLRGKSLGVFPPDSKVRTKLCDFMVHPWIEPGILMLIILQAVLLAVDAAPHIYEQPHALTWNGSWIDYTIFVLFIIYTLEICIRTIVSGFVINPVEYSTINRQVGLRQAVAAKAHTLFALHHDEPPSKQPQAPADSFQPSILRTFTLAQGQGSYANDARHSQRVRLAHRAFLRHSFNRLDFLAVISYWMGFVLAVSGGEANAHMHAFRMLGCLRILRLLSLSSGTSVSLFVIRITCYQCSLSCRSSCEALKRPPHCS